MNEELRVEYNYEEENGNVSQVWFSLNKRTITRFSSFDEFLSFVYAMEEMAETIAGEMDINLEYIDDDISSFTTDIKRFLN